VRVAMLLALPLAGCGGAGLLTQDDCGVPRQIHVTVVDSLPSGRLGETDRCAGGGLTEIRVLRGVSGVTAVRLAAHELAHAAGFSPHLPDPFCILYEDILPVLPGPCPVELAWMLGVSGQLEVFPDAEVRDDVAAAAAHWNTAVARELFVVR
jgi:hypothetical protein